MFVYLFIYLFFKVCTYRSTVGFVSQDSKWSKYRSLLYCKYRIVSSVSSSVVYVVLIVDWINVINFF